MTDTPDTKESKRFLATYDIGKHLTVLRLLGDKGSLSDLGDDIQDFCPSCHEVICEKFDAHSLSVCALVEQIAASLMVADCLMSVIIDRTLPQEGEATLSGVYFHTFAAIASDTIGHAADAVKVVGYYANSLDGSRSRPKREEANP